MAYTRFKKLTFAGGGNPGTPYFHDEDVKKVLNQPGVVGHTVKNAEFDINGQLEQIDVLIGIIRTTPVSNPPILTDPESIVALPCPPLDAQGAGIEL